MPSSFAMNQIVFSLISSIVLRGPGWSGFINALNQQDLSCPSSSADSIQQPTA